MTRIRRFKFGIRRVFAVLACVTTILGPAALSAEEQSVSPGVNNQYRNPEFSVWLARFESPGREVYDFRNEIVDILDLQPDMIVADVGAGTGLFSLLFAKRVGPGGRVYAVDISPVFVKNIQRRADSLSLKNITGVVGSDKSAQLPANQADLIFMCDTYHHFEYPQSMLASLYSSLKPGGRLVIVDFRKIPQESRQWILGHVRADEQTVTREVLQAGFRQQSEFDLLSENYFLQFYKPGK